MTHSEGDGQLLHSHQRASEVRGRKLYQVNSDSRQLALTSAMYIGTM